MNQVSLKSIIAQLNVKNYLEEIDLSNVMIESSEINRLALQLTGFFKHFDSRRIQVIGNVEASYIEEMTSEEIIRVFQKIFEEKVPCIVFCNKNVVPLEVVELAKKMNVPILTTSRKTSEFISEATRILNVILAPMISIHGVLLNVFGEGMLLTGNSGVGKSETALDLIKRGHRLIADDQVNIYKVSDSTLIGRAPDILKSFFELRGIGILDAGTMFGMEAIDITQKIDMVVHLINDEDNQGIQDDKEIGDAVYLGNRVKRYQLHLHTGSNVPVLCETIALQYHSEKVIRQNSMINLI